LVRCGRSSWEMRRKGWGYIGRGLGATRWVGN